MIYKYKATIPGSKVFLREYEIKGETTLYSLHDFLLNDLGFAPDQMVVFRGLDDKERVKREYGLFDMGDGTMDTVTLVKTLSRGETNLLYVFDLHNDRFIKLAFVEEVEPAFRASYPRLVAEKGRNPEQFAKGYDDFDQFTDPVDDGGDDSTFMEEELPEGTGENIL
ncbi:MAG: hypothetical protein RR555_05900 [Bacteroidales bacterium]